MTEKFIHSVFEAWGVACSQGTASPDASKQQLAKAWDAAGRFSHAQFHVALAPQTCALATGALGRQAAWLWLGGALQQWG